MAGGNGTSPCASCKLLRRRCSQDCIFAPYFPSNDPHKFAIVHKVFGASNVSKMLQELPVHQRKDAVSSLVYEANARVREPVYGCVGAISCLQNQVAELQMQLAVAQAEILCIKMQQESMVLPSQQTDLFTDDERTFFLDNNLPQYLNFPSSSSSTVIHDSLKSLNLQNEGAKTQLLHEFTLNNNWLVMGRKQKELNERSQFVNSTF